MSSANRADRSVWLPIVMPLTPSGELSIMHKDLIAMLKSRQEGGIPALFLFVKGIVSKMKLA